MIIRNLWPKIPYVSGTVSGLCMDLCLNMPKFHRSGTPCIHQFKIGYSPSLPTGCGRESRYRRFQGGTIYNDAASSVIWVKN